MDVPLYTVTGWGDGSVPPGEVIPLWGGYPDESWVPNIEKITGRGNYAFGSFRDDETIGNAQVKKKDNYLDHEKIIASITGAFCLDNKPLFFGGKCQ